MKYALSAAFILSAAFMPWWLVVVLAVVLLAEWQSFVIVVAGGMLRDLLFGAPQPALFGFSMLYTLIFGALALLAWYLHRHMLER